MTGHARVEVFPTKGGEFQYRRVAANNETTEVGESYPDLDVAMEMAEGFAAREGGLPVEVVE